MLSHNLWFMSWRNWMSNILIQWSSLLSLSDFYWALPWSEICSVEYETMLSIAPKQILFALLKCLDKQAHSYFADIWFVIKHSFKQWPVSSTYLSPQALQSVIYHRRIYISDVARPTYFNRNSLLIWSQGDLLYQFGKCSCHNITSRYP